MQPEELWWDAILLRTYLLFYYQLNNKKTKKKDLGVVKFIFCREYKSDETRSRQKRMEMRWDEMRSRQKRITLKIYVWQNIFSAENKNQMRWGVEVIGWLNLCFFWFTFFAFFCLQRTCTCKNLCTFFVFFCLKRAHQSFFSSVV